MTPYTEDGLNGTCDQITLGGLTLEIVSNLVFSQEAVLLDGKHFVDCTLDACELRYGGGIVIFERTRISGCDYMFGGQAGRTVDLLKIVGILAEPCSMQIRAGERIN